MGRYGHKSMHYKDFSSFTMVWFVWLWSTNCGSHGRGPRFDPLCVHHPKSKTDRSSNRRTPAMAERYMLVPSPCRSGGRTEPINGHESAGTFRVSPIMYGRSDTPGHLMLQESFPGQIPSRQTATMAPSTARPEIVQPVM